jgi:antitoxin component of RelBE/YafQ-DinJ toxin-antitoxin module
MPKISRRNAIHVGVRVKPKVFDKLQEHQKQMELTLSESINVLLSAALARKGKPK